MDMTRSKEKAELYRRRLKWVYGAFLLGFALTSISKSGIARMVGGELEVFFRYHVYFVFEFYLRPILVALGAYYTIRATIALKGQISRFRVISLLSFIVSMTVFAAIIPSIHGLRHQFMGFAYMFMPFPWLSSVLQVGLTGATYRSSFVELFGDSGVMVAAMTYLGFQLFVFIPTLFYGRRWYCSMACVFAGAHAESKGDALPLIAHNKKKRDSRIVHPKVRVVLRIMLWLQVGFTTFVHIGLLTWLLGGTFPISIQGLLRLELVRFLVMDTFLLNSLWWAVGGRAYCYYCAPGLLLGAIGRGVGQRIETNLAKCTDCGLCSHACKMSIDVAAAAVKKVPVKTVYCVGCGLCVDACPKSCLRYSTGFTRWFRARSA